MDMALTLAGVDPVNGVSTHTSLLVDKEPLFVFNSSLRKESALLNTLGYDNRDNKVQRYEWKLIILMIPKSRNVILDNLCVVYSSFPISPSRRLVRCVPAGFFLFDGLIYPGSRYRKRR